MLKESGVKAELSATLRTGVQQYTFTREGFRQIGCDLNRSTYRGDDAYYISKRGYNILQSQIRVVDNRTIEGYRLIT